jgi:hypothetical protein
LGNAAVDLYTAIFPTLTLDAEKITNVRLQIADIMGWHKEAQLGSHIATAVDDGFDPQMLIGADFFRAHRVYVARSQGLIYFSYLGGPIFQDPRASAEPPMRATPTEAPPDSP